MPDHVEGRRSQRDAPEGPGAIPSAEPGGQCAGRLGAATIWGNLPADPGVRGSRETRGSPTEPDGRSPIDQRLNLILPAGDVRIGNRDYNIYANSQVPEPEQINQIPLKSVGLGSVVVADVGKAEDAGAIQTNVVRIDGQKSVYIPILKQGGDSNTIAIVDGVRGIIKHLVDVPESLRTAVVFDQSIFVKTALRNLLKEGAIGLVLTGLMILLFLGSLRATVAVLLSIPLSALACFLVVNAMGGSINTMLLGGLALAFSRLIDNSVVVLENIFRFMEHGAT